MREVGGREVCGEREGTWEWRDGGGRPREKEGRERGWRERRWVEKGRDMAMEGGGEREGTEMVDKERGEGGERNRREGEVMG